MALMGLASMVVLDCVSFVVSALLISLPVVAFMVSEATMLQSGVADQYRGRVMGSYGMALALAMLIGMGVASALGDWVGVVPMLDLVSGLYVLAGVIVLVLVGGYQPATAAAPALSGEG